MTPITRNFTLEELTVTSTGIDNDPNHAEQRNLWALAFCLQQIRDVVGPLRVTSAFRSPAVNMAVGGSDSSMHRKGLAADVIPLAMDRLEMWRHLQEMVAHGLMLDQAIIYESKPHIHLGLRLTSAPRREFLVHLKQPVGGRQYVPWDTYRGELKR